jgi:hypothetical protein
MGPIRMIKSRIKQYVWHAAFTGEMTNVYKVMFEKIKGAI